MEKEQVIKNTVDFVKKTLADDSSGHDWWHIYRVWMLAKHIGKEEKADLFVVELGALLHDIADYKFHDGDDEIGGKVTEEWLLSQEVDKEIVNSVKHIVDNVSFKGNRGETKIKSLEGKVVQDADRLDAIGAMGIARCFAYGGAKGRQIYDPDIKPNLDMSKEDYKKHKGTQINHFYEKLLLLKDLMNTQTGKKMAQKRHEFMLTYLDEFYSEWDGKA